MDKAVQVQHVSKDFIVGDRPVRVLHSIDLDIYDHELTMLVGPSGCGKTTLLSIISGILSPTEGDILLFGQSLGAMTDEEKVLRRRHDVGFIFQQYNLLSSLTVAENAALPLLAASVEYEHALARAGEVMSWLGMGDQINKLPRQLSGGEQQRVAIARALVHNPRLIVCDEPTAALDAKTGASVLDILRTIALEEKRSVVVVTHDERIFRFADRIVTMDDGLIIEDKRVHE
jgi:putative ABC transport system ATP-binding protein